MSLIKEIHLKTYAYISFTDISNQIKDFVKSSNILNGIILVYTPHTTAMRIISHILKAIHHHI